MPEESPPRLYRHVVHALLQAAYGVQRVSGTGAFGRRGAKVREASRPPGSHPLKTALWKHRVQQFNDAACSVASIATLLNAVRSLQVADALPVGQTDLLDRVATGNWKRRITGRKGDRGRRGLPLALLGQVVENSLDAFGVAYRSVSTVTVTRGASAAGIRERLWKRLRNFERGGDGVILAHFDQGVYVKALHIPHISPVGGVDLQTGDVTILDVDPLQEGPYTVPFDTFYRGLAADYHHIFRPFGYGAGGYVHVRLR